MSYGFSSGIGGYRVPGSYDKQKSSQHHLTEVAVERAALSGLVTAKDTDLVSFCLIPAAKPSAIQPQSADLPRFIREVGSPSKELRVSIDRSPSAFLSKDEINPRDGPRDGPRGGLVGGVVFNSIKQQLPKQK